MSMYQFVKSKPQVRIFEAGRVNPLDDVSHDVSPEPHVSPSHPLLGQKKSRSIYSYVLIGSGMMILVWVFWPIVSFSLFTSPVLSAVVSPMQNDENSGDQSRTFSSLGALVTGIGAEDGSTLETTNANTWFPTKPQKKIVTSVTAYTMSIPKLGIRDATVIIGGDDLNKSLIHYGGTGLPGEYGTAVVFGHSVLPQFFSGTNYKSIFSTLPSMKIGDDIYVTYDGVQYRYKVFDMIVTKPTDLSPLEQRFDDSYITLVTCVPPGTLWERLNIKARLVKPGNT